MRTHTSHEHFDEQFNERVNEQFNEQFTRGSSRPSAEARDCGRCPQSWPGGSLEALRPGP